MHTHLHRITLNVDVETDERLGLTKDEVQARVFDAVREHYKDANIVVTVTDCDCLAPEAK